MNDTRAEAGRLLWRCRRGMKELDVVLDRFARAAIPQLSGPGRVTLASFLELPDPVLAGYLLHGEVPADPEYARLVGSILAARP
ncbi:MAG TPA: succinate dehydrogenase assembly factor 2 [Steroidobacteraceae bacterium]|jgi:antitoxin CptB